MPQSSTTATIEALLIELDDPSRSGEFEDELRLLHSRQVLRVIDVVLVNRDVEGQVNAHGRTELSPDDAAQVQHSATDALGFEVGAHQFGAGVRWEGTSVLLGDEDVRFIAGMLKPGQSAMAVVFEHRWAKKLGDMLGEPGVRLVEDDLYTSKDAAHIGSFRIS